MPRAQTQGCDRPGRAHHHALQPADPGTRVDGPELKGFRIGTVDKFQGQEAPISIYSMATSSADDAPRGMEFLYSLNRLNVATSRGPVPGRGRRQPRPSGRPLPHPPPNAPRQRPGAAVGNGGGLASVSEASHVWRDRLKATRGIRFAVAGRAPPHRGLQHQGETSGMSAQLPIPRNRIGASQILLIPRVDWPWWASDIVEVGETIMRNPELGFKEFETAALVQQKFDELELDYRAGLARTGVKARIDTGRPGPTLALIGELDALVVAGHPMENPETHAAHACGHNAQIAGLMGAAAALSDPRILRDLCGSIGCCLPCRPRSTWRLSTATGWCRRANWSFLAESRN